MNDEQKKDFKEIKKSLKELEDIISKTNLSDIKDITNTVAKASGVYEKFPESELVAIEYVQTLSTLARFQDSQADVTATVAKIHSIYEKFPESELVAIEYVQTLRNLACRAFASTLFTPALRQDTLADVTVTVAKIHSIYEKFPESEDIAIQYVSTLNILSLSQNSLADATATVVKASDICEKFPESENVASEYVQTLSTLVMRQDLVNATATVAKIHDVYEKFPESEDIVMEYVRILSILAMRQDSLTDVTVTVAKIHSIYEKFPESEVVAYTYVLTLSILARLQDSQADVRATVAKACDIYEKFPESELVASEYVQTLSTLARLQDSQADVAATVAKVYDIYKKFYDFESVAYAYVKTLVYLASRQDTKQDLMETFTEVINIYTEFSKKEHISSAFATVISEYINNINSNFSSGEKVSVKERLKILFNCLSNDNYELTEYIIGNIFYFNNGTDSFNSDTVSVTKEMFKIIIEFGVELTRYAPLIELLKDLEDCYWEQLIKIYWIVQKIKYQLSVKDLTEKKFGHYTSGEVLQIFLKQSKDSKNRKEEYYIREHSRLCNVKYMNDPEEGTVLDKYLGISESDYSEDFLKPSPWFLMSLTTEIDNLAMWSQYGARAEGVCLVLKTDSFKVYESMAETEWMGKFGNSILEKKLISTKCEETNSSYEKDYLYRICYLDEESLNNGDSNVVKEDNNNMLDDEEIKSINTSLVELKQFLNNIAKDSLLNNAIEECLEEIRYLFKVSGYSYESELRILKYAMLDPDNKDIKIDDKSGPVAKLYLERVMPIQLEQVIFGPKFSNPEHVVPLLHLLDKEIELKRSERKFK